MQPDYWNFKNTYLPTEIQQELMRFTGLNTNQLLRDPSQQLAYGYVSGNPLVWVDPFGLASCPLDDIVVRAGGIIGVSYKFKSPTLEIELTSPHLKVVSILSNDTSEQGIDVTVSTGKVSFKFGEAKYSLEGPSQTDHHHPSKPDYNSKTIKTGSDSMSFKGIEEDKTTLTLGTGVFVEVEVAH